MGVESVLSHLESSMDARRVFSGPIEKDGATIILAASVYGGGGGGDGQGDVQGNAGRSGSGSGIGFGLRSRPAGAFVIRQGRVRWQPALDLNRAILGGQLVVFSAFLMLRAFAKRRMFVLPRRGLFGRRLRFA